MSGLIVSLILYLVFLVIIFAWVSYKKAIPMFAFILLFLSSVFPLITLMFGNIYLAENQHFSFMNAGPTADWISGSSIPFLTLATFWIAFEAYKSQREQIVIAQNDSKEARRLPLIPFLHLEILDSTVCFDRDDIHTIHFKTGPDIPRLAFVDGFAMRSNGYESLHIRLTNIGPGLATQLLFDKIGETSDSVSVNKGDHTNLNSFFIQPNISKDFLIYFPMIEDDSFNYDLHLSYCDIIGNVYSQEYRFHFHSNNSLAIRDKKIRNYSISLISEGSPEINKKA